MKEAQPKAIRLEDYRPSAYLIEHTNLNFDLYDDHALVSSELHIIANPEVPREKDLVLNGQELELVSLALNGEPVATEQFELGSDDLRIKDVPDNFTLQTVCRIKPQDNKSLEGLYRSRTMFCTQCEAEGFRKITWYLDRPDIMARFTATVTADKSKYPVLLSNGNPVEMTDLDGGRHSATWVDPFPKPAYLFALVAGELSLVSDTFTTMSGRNIDLRIYVEEKDLNKCDHAMRSLKASMKWDEQTYGREYDLDIYMIVAVDDFNMGAMENKGLNIFNTSCVLANQEMSTDAAFQRVEGVIAHEYFHNWSGNRVTCRDWFQLSLKEGFTVFRDAQFSADMNSAAVKRIEDVTLLRTMQFAEDAGPTAHPVRPDSYIEINNFYTLTIYEKGAEVVGMLYTLLGPEKFRAGSDLYFERHDGQAATCDDFVAAMESVSGRDLGQFKRWYSQAGTPVLNVEGSYNAEAAEYRLLFKQSCPPSPGQAEKQPYVIPVKLGLVGANGHVSFDMPGAGRVDEIVLEVTEQEQELILANVSEAPVPSLLRGFSAPVKLHFPYKREQLLFLMANDVDGFNRWDASQQLATETLQAMANGTRSVFDADLIQAYRDLLLDVDADPAVVASMLSLPSHAYLSELAETIHPLAIDVARRQAQQEIGGALEEELLACYQRNRVEEAYAAEISQIARRAVANQALAYLVASGKDDYLSLANSQFQQAGNMTDSLAALTCLVHAEQDGAAPLALDALEVFYQRWKNEALAVNTWLQVQVSSPRCDVAAVRRLMEQPFFDLYNPNKVRAVIGTFAGANPRGFHAEDGSGYAFLAEQIAQLDGANPQIAARLITPLSRWRKYAPENAALMKQALETLAAKPDLSPDAYEIVSKSLA